MANTARERNRLRRSEPAAAGVDVVRLVNRMHIRLRPGCLPALSIE